jgi:hypothetical protein
MSVPSFPLLCNIYTAPNNPPAGPPRLAGVACNLARGRRSYPQDPLTNTGFAVLLLPAHTDIRDHDNYLLTTPNSVEVPAGSGRYYNVLTVDDVSKGFADEYRAAVIEKTSQWGLWPIPIP